MRLVLGALALGASLLPGLAQAAPDARCPWLGISPACDRQIQAAPPAGAAINTAHPNDIGMDSYNVPPVASVRARPPAPACPFGYQSGPSFDTSSWTWQYSCVPQTAQPAASACPYGFASGPTFNSGTNSWNYTCVTATGASLCRQVTQNPPITTGYFFGSPPYGPGGAVVSSFGRGVYPGWFNYTSCSATDGSLQFGAGFFRASTPPQVFGTNWSGAVAFSGYYGGTFSGWLTQSCSGGACAGSVIVNGSLYGSFSYRLP